MKNNPIRTDLERDLDERKPLGEEAAGDAAIYNPVKKSEGLGNGYGKPNDPPTEDD